MRYFILDKDGLELLSSYFDSDDHAKLYADKLAKAMAEGYSVAREELGKRTI